MSRQFTLLLTCVVASAALARAADNWPQWRGPASNGVAAPGEYPAKFSLDDGIAWKIDLPGRGMSTPAVWDGKIFVTCAIDGHDGVVAYDFGGKELWRKQFGDERPGKNQNASGSNPSPATDGKHLVVYYKSGTLACLDFAGNVKWQKNTQQDFGADTLWWDLASSPVIAGNRVVIAVMQGPARSGGRGGRGGGGDEAAEAPSSGKDSYLAAFDVDSGDIAWNTPRQYSRPMESDNSYTTPYLLTADGREMIVTFGADHLTAHDPATGKLLWDLDGFNPRDEANWRVIASPSASNGYIVVPYGRGAFLAGVRLGATKPEKFAWERSERNVGSDVPTPVAAGEIAYVLTDVGRIECINLATGKEIWAGDLPRNRNKYYSSPVLAGSKLYCTREDGAVFVVDVTEGYKLLAENHLDEKVIATPIPIRGGLLVRGTDHLFWIAPSGAENSQAAN